MNGPKIVTIDIETAPLTAYVWGLFDQNIGLDQIKEDWYILAWAARWHNDPAGKTVYMDSRNSRNPQNDKKLIQGLWDVLNEADIVVTQNGDKFDFRKFNARAIIHGLPPLKKYRSVDLLKEKRRIAAFTSNRLDYTTRKLNKKYVKLRHKHYPGFNLWSEVLKGNKKAWKEMERYCKHDVLSTDEEFSVLKGWIKLPNFAVYYDDEQVRCRCGSARVYKKGLIYAEGALYQGYKCKDCGKRPRGSINLMPKDKRKMLLKEGGK